MKTFRLFFLLLTLAPFALKAQGGSMGIQFQTIVRDGVGQPLANQPLSVRFSIKKGNPPTQIEYQETHAGQQTDIFGLINLVIGSGVPNAGNFNTVAWSNLNNNFHLEVEVNTGGGFVSLGATPMLFVPFAFHANTAEKSTNMALNELSDVNANAPANGQVLTFDAIQNKWIPQNNSGAGLWTLHANGNDIFYSGGNVGIGSTAPSTRLTLGGSGGIAFNQAFGTSQKDLISLYNNRLEQNNFTGLGFETATVQDGNNVLTERLLYNRAEGGFRWYINQLANGGGNAKMALTRSGALGLGTHIPQANLHISDYTDMSNSNSTGSLMIGQDNWLHLTMDRDEIQARNTNGVASALRLQHWGGNLAMCQGNGSVGIGTISPQGRLHIFAGNAAQMNSGGYLVMGNTSSDNMVLDENEIFTRDNGGPANLTLQRSSGDVGIGSVNTNARLNIDHDGWHLRMDNTETGGATWLVGASEPGWSAGADKLVFSNSTGSANGTLFLHGSSRGASIATADLPTGYRLAVNGKIICEELRVRVKADWPDYVFADNYRLRPLEEVEAHIKARRHLPGVPAAAEVQQEGLAVGEMQKVLMEKVEELTLYLIGQQKQIQSLQAEIQTLKAKQ